jgi:arylsulfatase A-like enzyme
MDSIEKVRMMFDGYDTGVKYADDHIGRVLNTLADLGVLDETAIVLSADHGENLGELNVYGDHQTADECTCHLPLIIRWPGVTDGQRGRVDDGLHYHVDFAATAVELAGGTVPESWDGRSFAPALKRGVSAGRDHLVLSQAAWCVQRAVRWDSHLYIRTWDDAWHDYPGEMLFDVARDPHELNDLAPSRADLVAQGRAKMDGWQRAMRPEGWPHPDPIQTVLSEGGSLHGREGGASYLDRLRATHRADVARRLAEKRGLKEGIK